MTRLLAYEHPSFWSAVRKDPNFPKKLEPFLTGDVGELLVSDQEASYVMRWAESRPEWDPKNPPLEAEPLAKAR